MAYAATLVCNPAGPVLTEALVREAARRLPDAETRWLDPGIAADLLFDPGDPADPNVAPLGEDVLLRDYRAEILDALAGAPVDAIVQPQDARVKRLFLADMDSTMIEQECIDELADFAGLKAQVAEITERAMRGEIAFEPALRERVALLKGLPVGIVDEIIRDRITLTPGGRTLLATLRAKGVRTCLVSGGFTLFTGPISSMIGFHEHRSNELLVDGDRLAGRVAEPILGREAKYATLIELRDALGLGEADTMAVGDGANDLAMLGEAGLGVAFRAKPKVAEAAAARIDHADLTALLYVQGYTREEFALGE